MAKSEVTTPAARRTSTNATPTPNRDGIASAQFPDGEQFNPEKATSLWSDGDYRLFQYGTAFALVEKFTWVDGAIQPLNDMSKREKFPELFNVLHRTPTPEFMRRVNYHFVATRLTHREAVRATLKMSLDDTIADELLKGGAL